MYFVFQGSEMFNSKINIEVSRASKKAIERVERQGGQITCAYYTKLGLRVLLKPWKFNEKRMPRRAAPPPKLEKYYRDPAKRGYLAEPEEIELERQKVYQNTDNDPQSLVNKVKNMDLSAK
jgi:large subunit ribosomal protein L15